MDLIPPFKHFVGLQIGKPWQACRTHGSPRRSPFTATTIEPTIAEGLDPNSSSSSEHPASPTMISYLRDDTPATRRAKAASTTRPSAISRRLHRLKTAGFSRIRLHQSNLGQFYKKKYNIFMTCCRIHFIFFLDDLNKLIQGFRSAIKAALQDVSGVLKAVVLAVVKQYYG